MNALAISAVVSPPTARSVRAIAEAGVSAGWQHMNSTVNVSSSSGTSRPGGSCRAATVSRSLRDCSLRHWSISLPLGGLDQPAARAGRDAVPRPVHGRREQRLLDGILGGVEVAVPAGEHAEDLRRELAQQGLDVGLARQRTPPRLTALARGSAAASAKPSGPGTAEYLAAISIARSSDSTSTIM